MAQDNLMQSLKNFQRQFPREAQKAKVEIQRVIAEGGAPDPTEIAEILRIAKELQASPAAWAKLRPELAAAGMPEEMLPPPNAPKEQLAKIIGVLIMTVYLLGQGPAGDPEAPQSPQVQGGLINQGVSP